MEPGKEKITLNNEQQAAAYCDKNAVVAAGAGSGKTMVLASRFAWLVTERKCRVREILTLTFTKKAAAQMYRRIHLLLAETAVDSGIKGKLAREALEEFAQARIQTLDSYSAAIVKQAANHYGISPEFSIDEERCLRLAHDEAMSFFIAKREHPAMQRLYPNKSPVSIANNIFAAGLFNYTHIDIRPNPEKDFTRQCNTICGEWEKQSGQIINMLRKISEANTEDEKLLPDLAPVISQFTAGKIVFPNVAELGEYFKQLTAIPHDSIIKWTDSHPLQTALANVTEFLLSVISLNLKKGKQKNNPVKELIKELRDIFKEFSSLMIFCMQAGLTYSTLKLLSDLQLRYLERKRAESVLTYTDVARLAKTILIEQKDIRQSEKESFKAIMIDEFQDNNELQKDLLFLIAEKTNITNKSVPPAKDLSPGKLFFVGDEKQSVYLFRGADVSVFRKLKNELGSSDLPLKTNYRSAPVLIGAFNTLFGGYKFDPEGKAPALEAAQSQGERSPAVFAPAGDDLPPFEASFSPLHASKKSGGKLTLCILDKQTSPEIDSPDDLEGRELERLSPVENEARYVALRIEELLKEKNETGEYKYRPGDIAILFRTRSSQRLFEKHLMLLNIPYVSEELNGFFYGGPVDDLMSVLRLAAYPKDSAAYAQMLRSPFTGLSMQGLALCVPLVAASAGTGMAYSPFSDEPLALLSEDDRNKYLHGKRIYQKILDIAHKESISSLVSELWYGEGYRYETEWNPKTAAYRELYDYLFHLAALADEKNQGLAEFTDYIQGLYNTDERLRDIEIPLERPSAVRLITIHKSKGLEFPVVFICCCNKKVLNDKSDDLYLTEDSGLTFTPPLPREYSDNAYVRRSYFWERSMVARKEKKIAELRRLLYVGMTRAENELFLSGCIGISKTLGLENRDQNSAVEEISRYLKQYIDLKIEKAEGSNSIKGDTILEGNTFFGLCLPAFGAHLAEGAGDSFFHIEEIPAYSEQQIRDAEKSGSRFSNDQAGLNAFFELVEPFYKNANGIETPYVPKRHYTPTSLHCDDSVYNGSAAYNGEGHWTDKKDDYSGEASADIFGSVDTLIKHYAKQHGKDNEKFNYGSFGTIAHICIEALLSNQEINIPSHLTELVSSKDADAIISAGKSLAQRFAGSPLGNIARGSEKRKSEFPFRSLLYTGEKELFINGTIDLLFEDARTVYVIDFKTDSQELPWKHIAQMACYYRAASDLFAVPSNKECRTWLYYLRTGHAVDVTMKAKSFNFREQITGNR
ncbi:MAG: UvrD-helicase domain-containing protein [Treponema sp.]|jgi:ATP-dependent helicase/nuclease subunit A|nr:UvrD-helicase domain-containing protein [Treponema sp.]